jgi:hypothetical protein
MSMFCFSLFSFCFSLHSVSACKGCRWRRYVSDEEKKRGSVEDTRDIQRYS